MTKSSLYREYITRMDAAHREGQNLQAIWYAYAILEDRLISMLDNSGGVPVDKKGKPIRMLGPKREALAKRTKTDPLLKVNFDNRAIRLWSKDRNDLMHGMADGSLSLQQVDSLAQQTADTGVSLVRSVCSAAMRLKKHR